MDIEFLKQTICEAFSISQDELKSDVRRCSNTILYARIIFSYNVFVETSNISLIKLHINSNSDSIIRYYINKYEEEIERNRVFSNINNKIKTILNENKH